MRGTSRGTATSKGLRRLRVELPRKAGGQSAEKGSAIHTGPAGASDGRSRVEVGRRPSAPGTGRELAMPLAAAVE
jgi:hypothetical protein